MRSGTTVIGAASVAAAAHDILSATHGDTLVAAVVRGDLVLGNSTPKWSRLAIGLTKKYLKSDGTDAAWAYVTAIQESGGTVLDVAAITDGEFLKRSGATIISAAAGGVAQDTEVIVFPITGAPVAPNTTATEASYRVSVGPLTGRATERIVVSWSGNPIGGTQHAYVEIYDLTNSLVLWSKTRTGVGPFGEILCETGALANLPASCANLVVRVKWDAADAGTITVNACPMLRTTRT